MSRKLAHWGILATVLFSIIIGTVELLQYFNPFDVHSPEASAQGTVTTPTGTMSAIAAVPVPTPAPTPTTSGGSASEAISVTAPAAIESSAPFQATPDVARPAETTSPATIAPVPIPEPSSTPEAPVQLATSSASDKPVLSETEEIIDAKGGTIVTEDGRVSISIPEGAADEALLVRISTVPTYGERLAPEKRFVSMWKFEALAIDRQMTPVHGFSRDIDITIQLSQQNLNGMNPETLEFWTRSVPGEAWKIVPGNVDAETRTLQVRMNHFSEGGATAAGLFDFAPSMANYAVGLHMGSANVNIPIEVPAGLGGLTPNLNLNYDSTRVNAMKTYDALGSWVGIGWDLVVGDVTRTQSPIEDEDVEDVYGVYPYSFEMPGAAGQMVEDRNTPGKWYTKQHDYLKIEFQNNTWTITDKSGTQYFFGETDESRQWKEYHTGYREAYRWNLSRIRDLKGNEIRVSYWQQFYDDDANGHADVIAAYPLEIKYAYQDSATPLALIRFNYLREGDPPQGDTYYKSGYGGWVRRDTTEDTVCYDDNGHRHHYYPPEMLETRMLTGVDVFRKYIGGGESLVRSYTFNYDLGSFRNLGGGELLPDGTGFCKVAAGLSRLLDVSVKGSEGNTLYTQHFTYCEEDDPVCDDNDFRYKKPKYDGSSMITWYHLDRWPLLHTASNGFGGSVQFEYGYETAYWEDEAPYTLPGWTHRVVDEKRVIPGGGQPDILTTYGYHFLQDYFPFYWVDDDIPYGYPDSFGAESRGARYVDEYTHAADGSEVTWTSHFYFTTCYPFDPGNPNYGCGDIGHDGVGAFTLENEILTGRERRTRTLDLSQGYYDLIREVNYEWDWQILRHLLINPGNGVKDFAFAYFGYLTEQDTHLKDGTILRTRTPESSYDAYGNLTTVYNDGDIAKADDDSVTYTPYHRGTAPYPPDKWIFLPKYKQVKDASETTVLAEERYFYDGASSTETLPTYGKLTAVQNVINAEGDTANTYYVYEPNYGRQLKQSVPTDIKPQDVGSAGVPQDVYYSETEYGTDDEPDNHVLFPKHSYVGKLNGATTDLTQTTTYDEWNVVLGVPSLVTAPNLNQSHAQYDEFGRPTKVWDSLDSQTNPTKQFDYQWNGTGGFNWTTTLQRTTSGSDVTLSQTVCFDGFGRKLQTRTLSAPNTDTVEAVKYDSRGLVNYSASYAQASGCAAFDESKPKTVTTYDALGNVATVTNPDGTSRSESHSGLTSTAVDENHHKTASTQDAFGQTVQCRSSLEQTPTPSTAPRPTPTICSAI